MARRLHAVPPFLPTVSLGHPVGCENSLPERPRAAFPLRKRVFTPHRMPQAHRWEKRRYSMQSPSHHLRALVKRIVTFWMLSVVCFTAAVTASLAGGTATHASTAAYSVTNLGTLSGNLDETTEVYAINNNGQ